MKTMKRLGCLLALVLFAGATAQAAGWFGNVVDGTTLTGWKIGEASLDSWDGKWVSDHIEFTDWDNALKYAPDSSEFQVTKDTAVSTQVKFSVMDYEDLTGDGAVDISDAKAGLTVAQPEGGVAAYYGIVNGEWVALEGAVPTTTAYVDVKVELFKKNGTTYVNYTIGTDPAVLLTYNDATDLPVAGQNVSATIASVEYLGQCDIATLAGAKWSNPCAIAGTLPNGVSGVTVNGEAYELGTYSIDRHSNVTLGFIGASGWTVSKVATAVFNNVDDDFEIENWNAYVKAEKIEVDPGTDVPGKITVDETKIAARMAATGATTMNEYLFGKQDNGQLGWVNYSLGIADDAVIAPTNDAPVAGYVAIGFGVEVAQGANVSYKVDNTTKEDGTPDIQLSSTKAENNKIHEVAMVLKDEAGVEHVVSTVTVGVMETGKDVDADAEEFTTYDIVAVPWESFGGAEITVADLLNTAMLTPDDVLYIQKDDANGEIEYDQYKLSNARLWAPKDSPAANKRTIKKGTAIWIERSNKSRIVFSGKLAEGASETPATKTAAAGTPEKPTWTLIANPSINPLDLDAIAPNPGDKIVIEDVADPRQYEYKNETWGYTKMVKEVYGNTGVTITKPQWVDNDNIVKPGIGFWYVNTGNAITITFPANAPATAD